MPRAAPAGMSVARCDVPRPRVAQYAG